MSYLKESWGRRLAYSSEEMEVRAHTRESMVDEINWDGLDVLMSKGSSRDVSLSRPLSLSRSEVAADDI